MAGCSLGDHSHSPVSLYRSPVLAGAAVELDMGSTLDETHIW